ncbi:PTS sugar transporter subunit IIA [Clostridium beijerinckii]|uniref:PTS system mannose-specific EIIAB component n=1 Tax=Clostridium beijerinckii TaxID=1520 RepID=A0A1S8SBP9_CLOBE|nr:PTS mannose transporter subunit IIA [Clostridium beijerinckii]NRY61904.1 PTS system mannose-specific IIA component/fructoselysine and glucoselysine-specific PTS system IIA component [Clostridium beijerinckii]OOM62990.1 PTS system mannose-specific EIIAB component [Clostridium beijerinckii]
MKKFLIATHGELSKEFIETSKLIVGALSNVEYFCMTKDKSGDDAEKEMKRILSNKSEEERYIVLTDIFGGSVANLCTNLLLNGYEFELITGINLPMILTILLSDEDDIETLVRNGIEESRKGIIHVNELLKNNKERNEEDDIIDEN